MEETFELLRDRIFKAGLETYSGRQVVLTGGGAHLNGVRELATNVLGKRVRIGQPYGVFGLSDELSQPDFAVATGLLKRVFDGREEVVMGPPDLSGRRMRAQRYSGNAVARTAQWLRENF
jgi:cell division protein FtsA